ncbi:MAG: hypothetical protein ACKOYK_05530 [Cyanobium sp.]
MGQRIFLTFTDRRMRAARKRICKQATDLQFYHRVIGGSERSLDREFRKKYKAILNADNKYGYYIWKPRIVKQVLSSLREGDLLHYLDAGSHLNPAGLWRLEEYFKLAEDAPLGFLGFENKPPAGPLVYDGRPLPDNSEYLLTKGDLLDWFHVRNRPEICRSQQIGATTFIVRKCKESTNLIDEWNNVFDQRQNLIDDSPSISPNEDGFICHRFDQSILSILAKLHRVQTVSVFECWYPSVDNCWVPDWDYLKDYPIWMKRDRGIKYTNSLYIKFLQKKGEIKKWLLGKAQ